MIKLTKDRMKDTAVITASNITRDLREAPWLLFSFDARAERRMARDATTPVPKMLGRASAYEENRKCRSVAMPAASPTPPLAVAKIG